MPSIPGAIVTNMSASFMRRIQVAEFQPSEVTLRWEVNLAEGADPQAVADLLLTQLRTSVLNALSNRGAPVAEAASTTIVPSPAADAPKRESAAAKKAREAAEAAAAAAAQTTTVAGMPGGAAITTPAATGMPGGDAQQHIQTGGERTDAATGMPGGDDAGEIDLDAMLAGTTVATLTKAEVMAQIAGLVQKAKTTPALINEALLKHGGVATFKTLSEEKLPAVWAAIQASASK